MTKSKLYICFNIIENIGFDPKPIFEKILKETSFKEIEYLQDGMITEKMTYRDRHAFV